jgi:DMSO/TMAO reductase YedYZ molybdopterin-dependent catalytic subunit
MNASRRAAALSGLAAVAAALGVGELVALLTGPRSGPVVAVGGAVIDLVPEPVKHFAITVFGTHDKLALQVGTLVLLGLAGAGLGLLARWRLWVAIGGVAVFAAVGAVAAVTRFGAGPGAALPSLLGGIAGAAVLWRLSAVPESAVPESDQPEERDAEPGRRRILRAGGAILAIGAATAAAGRWFNARHTVTTQRAAVKLPEPASPAPALPVGAESRVGRLTPFVTRNSTFYLIDTALVVPQVAPEQWKLRIHGRVRKPLTVTYKQLLARPMIERYITLTCVSNEVGGGLAGNARWLGVRVADLLAEAEPEDGADQVVSRSVDGFTAGTPTAVLRDGRDAILAVGMNGEPLPVEHGFPVRMVVPGLYGYVSATKWLAELELTSFADYDAYWIKRGWAAKAPIKLQSRIDTPGNGRRIEPGTVVVGGVAWAQHVGVSKVEVRVDDGPWREATLEPVPSADTWRQWTVPWDATPGKHRLTVRAYDTNGTRQDETQRPPIPDGATGWHSVECTVG